MANKKNICFLMPFWDASVPCGGAKIVLQHANCLVDDGYKVTIVYPYDIKYNKDYSILARLNTLYKVHKCHKVWKGSVWFNKHDGINEVLVPSLYYKHVPKADIYIATGVDTAEYVSKYPVNDKYYLIQDYENWGRSDQSLIRTYHYPLKKIAISGWLQDIVKSHGEKCSLVPNGFEMDKFFITKPVPERDRYSISMLYNLSERKDYLLAFRALELVHQAIPEVRVKAFGVLPRPITMPEWFEYHQKPILEELLTLYNSTSIFIGTSRIEGWGLTVGEAMLCGNAIACTDILGYKEMVVDRYSALLSPIGDAQVMAANIIKLIENDSLRISIAEEGNKVLQEFTFNKSYSCFKNALNLN